MEYKSKQYQRLRQMIRGKILRNEPLSEHTSFKIGGPAEYYIYPADLEDLTKVIDFCSREGIKRFIIGNGTNILFSDEGFEGIIIDLTKTFCKLGCRNDIITAGAGVSLRQLLKYCIERGYAGLEWTAGIPGAVGGSIKMNAGAHGQEIGDRVDFCSILDKSGSLEIQKQPDLKFAYRSVGLQSQSIVVETSFKLEEGNPKELDRIRQAYLKERKKRQPLTLPSAGSIFKNPADYSAGRLIDEAGCKGMRIGDAMVSKKHANFIVNCSRASAVDVVRIISEIGERVQNRFGVRLELELEMEGFTI